MNSVHPYTIRKTERQACLTRHLSRFVLLIVNMALITTIPLAAATDLQTAEVLHQTVLTFLKQQTAQQSEQEVEIHIGHLDRRLRLTECAVPPAAFLSPGAKLQGKLSVGVRCNDQKPWTVYIPAQIKNFATIVVAAHPLPRGKEISNSDLMMARQDLGQVRGGYYTKSENIIGNILTRSMSTGQAFTAKNVKPPLLMHRGDDVTILASIGGLQVRVKGQALNDAALGEHVSVRNKQSKRIVQGTAVKPGIVNVQM
jgi:flagella basal body P-ring formation protein FlgA